ncbi:MAG: PQQ-binding-like beta-propeller repeat protein [Dehalococcoidales bacterium]|nr:PQQ-binding-like beta-propeller repeat protein [Dehalococcoidales bacterium]
MHLSNTRKSISKLLLLVIALLIIGLSGISCVQGLQPIGWSGGVVSGDSLYLGTKEGKLVKITIADQSRKWSEPLKTAPTGGALSCMPSGGGGCSSAAPGVAIYGTPAAAGELIYMAGYNGKIYAYNSATMADRWVYPRESYLEAIVSGPVVAQNKVIFGCSDGKVYALDAANGDKLWEFSTGDKIWGNAAVAGNTVYIGSFDKKLYALNIGDGTQKWVYTTEGAIGSTPLVQDGTVYIGSFDRNLYALDAATGDFKWKFTGGSWFWACPLIINNNIYAGCLDGKVYVLSTGGNKINEFDLGYPISSTPVVVDNLVIFATQKGTVSSLNTSNGEIRLLLEIKQAIYGPLTAHDGIVYIHTQDLNLHRVNVRTGAVLPTVALSSKG